MGRKKEVEIGKVILKLRWKISPMILDSTVSSLPITPYTHHCDAAAEYTQR